jgi:hypothetical protein
VNLLRLELCEERADHRLTATLRPQHHGQDHRRRERRERRRRPYQRRRRSWSGSDSRPSDDSDDDRWPRGASSASVISVRSQATTISLTESRAESPVDPWRWAPFEHQQAMDRGRCLETSVRPRVLSNIPLEEAASEPSNKRGHPQEGAMSGP